MALAAGEKRLFFPATNVGFVAMKLVVQVKLCPQPEQAAALSETLARCNAAANFVSERAFATRVFRRFGADRFQRGRHLPVIL